MCGLIGIAGDLEFKDEATIKRLLIYDYFRGPDATGLASLRKNGEVRISKLATHPLDLFDTKMFDKTLDGYNSTVLLGHNRLATKGKKVAVNAHPYQYGHIVGAHNGTLDDASWKRLNAILGYDTDVDSQAIFAVMEQIGVEDTIKLLQEGRTGQEGAWALTWFDTEERTMNFLRNQWRPLWYAYSKDFKKVFWASEWPMIDAATKLSTQGYELYSDQEGYRFWEMNEDWWYRFKVDELRAGPSSQPKPRVKELKGREPAPVATSAQGTPPFRGSNVITMGTPPGTRSYSQKTTTPGSTGGASSIDVLAFKSHLPLGTYMDQEQFEQYTKYGCSWCRAKIPFGAVGITIYEQTGEILCQKCSPHQSIDTRIYTHGAEITAFEKVLRDKDAVDEIVLAA